MVKNNTFTTETQVRL